MNKIEDVHSSLCVTNTGARFHTESFCSNLETERAHKCLSCSKICFRLCLGCMYNRIALFVFYAIKYLLLLLCKFSIQIFLFVSIKNISIVIYILCEPICYMFQYWTQRSELHVYTTKHQSIPLSIKLLHWLPVQSSITYKLALIVQGSV